MGNTIRCITCGCAEVDANFRIIDDEAPTEFNCFYLDPVSGHVLPRSFKPKAEQKRESNVAEVVMGVEALGGDVIVNENKQNPLQSSSKKAKKISKVQKVKEFFRRMHQEAENQLQAKSLSCRISRSKMQALYSSSRFGQKRTTRQPRDEYTFTYSRYDPKTKRMMPGKDLTPVIKSKFSNERVDSRHQDTTKAIHAPDAVLPTNPPKVINRDQPTEKHTTTEDKVYNQPPQAITLDDLTTEDTSSIEKAAIEKKMEKELLNKGHQVPNISSPSNPRKFKPTTSKVRRERLNQIESIQEQIQHVLEKISFIKRNARICPATTPKQEEMPLKDDNFSKPAPERQIPTLVQEPKTKFQLYQCNCEECQEKQSEIEKDIRTYSGFQDNKHVEQTVEILKTFNNYNQVFGYTRDLIPVVREELRNGEFDISVAFDKLVTFTATYDVEKYLCDCGECRDYLAIDFDLRRIAEKYQENKYKLDGAPDQPEFSCTRSFNCFQSKVERLLKAFSVYSEDSRYHLGMVQLAKSCLLDCHGNENQAFLLFADFMAPHVH